MAIRVIELFAGVGGFRLGLDRVKHHDGSPAYRTIWSNQWEPDKTTQHASDIYVKAFGSEGHSNEDIERVVASQFSTIPDHDLLVGGFPCQDYSVARPLNQAEGLVGRKGVLWWSIHTLLERKKNRPAHLLLENVDRLIKSPASQKGRDFAVMLASLANLGYAVEWRVVNAADYGQPQRRRRVFIIGHHVSSASYQRLANTSPSDWLVDEGPMAQALPCEADVRDWPAEFTLDGDLAQITNEFGRKTDHIFHNTGLMIGRKVFTIRTKADYLGPHRTLSDVLQPLNEVSKEYYLTKAELPKWKAAKGNKKIERTSASGHTYLYGEGAMAFPDPIDRPSRTIVTGEGGTSPSRMKHVVEQNGVLRRLTPIELERLMGFPDNHTEGLTPTRRAFLMGNALVVGIVEKIGSALAKEISNSVKLAKIKSHQIE